MVVYTKRIDETTVLVEIDIGEGTLRKTRIAVGDRYQVNPLNPLRDKNRGRVCEVRGFFAINDWRNSRKAYVLFVDNHRMGKVNLEDLVELI